MKLDLSVRLILFISYSFINKIDQLKDEFSLFIYLFILFSYFFRIVIFIVAHFFRLFVSIEIHFIFILMKILTYSQRKR